MDSPMIRVLKYLEAGNEIVAVGRTGNTHYRFLRKYGVIWASGADVFRRDLEWNTFGPVLSTLEMLEQFLPAHLQSKQAPAPVEDVRMVEL